MLNQRREDAAGDRTKKEKNIPIVAQSSKFISNAKKEADKAADKAEKGSKGSKGKK